ncbi:Stp1/IreP family PP2C-type Ser/Thr phosphatase [Heliorestis acidaminivorans]|uniref:Stp1/IreP family PP2C-type Ser/Thr phosphatase n=1 Tax=Heliorestis acidaminivorans TaxID=553427 RepID=A0A6I0EXG3_9FIRM|nr:Stp1/IreP family PP2C-type Ser/Thr phosphatase [Heliorestis acidaminivorans]KAB2954469.1 Stp1/IreP family PP2C-type Ser/Thr phosphatase [Heliorestis acidaminivorans]
MKYLVQSIARTDIGKVRKTNEDSFLTDSNDRIFIVADGMGGHEAGEVASALAVKAIAEYFEKQDEASRGIKALEKACREANSRIYLEAQNNSKWAGMGTTVTALLITDSTLWITHVGDSRAYKYSGGRLYKLTEDHSLVEEMLKDGRISPEEAQAHPQRNIITRALGTKEEIDIDLVEEQWAVEDLMILCTDGLTNLVSEQEIEKILQSLPPYPYQQNLLEKIADRMMELVLERGGHDNVTFLILWQDNNEGWTQ